MKSLVHIGNTKGSVDATTKGILKILSAPHADESTKKIALDALARVAEINNVSITNSNFTGEPPKNKKKGKK